MYIKLLKNYLILALAINISKVKSACDNFSWECDNGLCIDKLDLCDGKIECSDGSDEIAENCIHLADCPGYAFKCSYGACISGNQRCDGTKHCADNSDELPLLCSKNIAEVELQYKGNCTEPGFMQCGSGECLEEEYKCDGVPNCKDGSDEIVDICSTIYCPSHSFRCGYGGCITGKDRCNNVKDCADYSDEASMLCGRPRRRIAPITDSVCQLPLDRQNLIILSAAGKNLTSGSLVPKNSIVQYNCPKGFARVGYPANVCNGNEWKYETPKCQKYCTNEKLTRGFSTKAYCLSANGPECGKRVPPGTKADIDCANFFNRPGPNTGTNYWRLRCLDNGEWDHEKPSCTMRCGEVAPPVTQLSKGGVPVKITDVPWHVGIYSIQNSVYYNYICGGTIISPRVVISAAHCFWDNANSAIFSPSLFTIAAGKYMRDYDDASEVFRSSVQKRNISEIYVDFNYKHNENEYRNDMAIIVLVKHLSFTDSIRPICTEFYKRAQQDVITNLTGNFAAWGENSVDSSKIELQSVDMSTLSYGECAQYLRRKNPNNELADDKFCIWNEYGRTACKGDSGGGFVIHENKNGRSFYRLVGVISNAPVTVQECARNGVVVLTNIQYFQEIIEEYFNREQDKDYSNNDI